MMKVQKKTRTVTVLQVRWRARWHNLASVEDRIQCPFLLQVGAVVEGEFQQTVRAVQI